MRQATGQFKEWRTKRGTTSYGVRFRYRGKRRFVTLGSSEDGMTRKTAETAMADLMADVRRGLWVPPDERAPEPEPREVPTFHEFATTWFRDREKTGGRDGKGLSTKARKDLRWRLSHHLLPLFADYRLDEIGVEDVDRYRSFKAGEGRLSAYSINRTIATLAAVLELAVEYGHVERNVAIGRRRRLKVARPRRTYLARAEQIEAVLDGAAVLDERGRSNVGPYRRALLATLVFAGLRIGELRALRWGDVDLAKGRLAVRGTKTENAERIVRLLPALRDELAALKARRDPEPDDLVFATATGAAIQETNVRRRVLGPAVDRANEALAGAGGEPIPDGITPHSLRRTFASILVALREDPATVMKQMGHATSHFTLSVYAAAMESSDEEREALRRLVEGESADIPALVEVEEAA
jgi:integrase